MINILDTVKGQLGDEALEMFAKQLGVDTKKAESLVDILTPLLTGALANNASTTKGVEALNTALDSKHDGSIFGQLTDFLSQGVTADGEGILGHVLGSKKDAIEKQVATATGEDLSTITKALAMLSPIVLGSLGKVKKEQGLNLEDLAGLLQTNKTNTTSSSLGGKLMLMLLDTDGDGDIKDDLLAMGVNKLKGMFKK